jgi:endonuclease YncB( thermonuclease family)
MILLFALALAAQTDFGVRTPGVPSAGQMSQGPVGRFACRVAYVHDGDTFRCADGTRIRLSGIDAPEMPGACRPGRSCAPGNPYQAKAALAALIDGRTVQCEPAGKSYNRIAAWCSVGGSDLSCAMMRSGYAIRLPKFDPRGRLSRC